MSPRTTARACTLAAWTFTLLGFYAGTWHPLLAAPGLASGAVLWLLARAYRREQRHDGLAAEQAARPIPDPDPVDEDAAWARLVTAYQQDAYDPRSPK